MPLTGCSFDVSGVPTTGAGDAADVCVPGCTDGVLTLCEPAPRTEPCDFGCDEQALTCLQMWPSNDADASHLDGADQALVIPANAVATIDSDTGAIAIEGVERRAAGGGVRDGLRLDAVGNDINVLSMTGLDIGGGAFVRISGTRPLILSSSGDVTLEGIIDLSAGCSNGTNTCGGPGGGAGSTAGGDSGGQSTEILASGCAPGQNGSGDFGIGTPETGGGGGSLGTPGGAGGDADGNDPGGAGGQLPGTCPGPVLIPLRGGSGGGAGGEGENGGTGGGGGGALQISSFSSIRIIGKGPGEHAGIRASGAGGMGGEDNDGGGGGGAGGAILLEAPRIELRYAILAANGGGGGAGGSNTQGLRGQDGPFGAEQAAGGAGGSNNGGQGASVSGPATAGEGGGDNTGGGGGGAGIIRVNVSDGALTVLEGVIISPAETRGELDIH